MGGCLAVFRENWGGRPKSETVTVFPGVFAASRERGAKVDFMEAHIHVRYTLWKSGTPEQWSWRDSSVNRDFIGFAKLETVANRVGGIYRMWRSIPPGRGMPRAIAMLYTRENVGLR